MIVSRVNYQQTQVQSRDDPIIYNLHKKKTMINNEKTIYPDAFAQWCSFRYMVLNSHKANEKLNEHCLSISSGAAHCALSVLTLQFLNQNAEK